MSEIIVELTINLLRSRMLLRRIEYRSMLWADKKLDKKETETLLAGYSKCLDDLEKVSMTIAEM